MEHQFIDNLTELEVYPCFSVNIPLKSSPTDKIWNEKMVDKIHKNVLRKIHDEFNNETAQKLENNLSQLISEVELTKNRKGVGLFFTPFSKRLIEFPYEIKEKISIDDHFDLKDISYLSSISLNYLLLELNDGVISLYEGYNKELREIKDKNFPIQIIDDYEYAKPSIAKSIGYGLQTTEDDADKIKFKRYTNYLKQAEKRLKLYTFQNQVLFVCGGKKEITLFKTKTDFRNKISGELSGDFIHQSISEKVKLLETTIKKYISQEEQKLLERLNDAFGKELAVCGIQDVWYSAKLGNGLILLVEKDFEISGYEVSSEPNLYLSIPEKEYDIVRDAVEDCISTVISKGGRVVVMENEKLKKFKRIALIQRYKS
jgi:hypothetical protein